MAKTTNVAVTEEQAELLAAILETQQRVVRYAGWNENLETEDERWNDEDHVDALVADLLAKLRQL